MADGQVVFEISSDGRKAYTTLDEFTRAVDQAGKKWDQSVNGSADNMQKSFTKAFDIERLKNFGLEIGKALMQFGKEAVDAASDLREVQNVVDVTFGENASQIDAWAKTAITQFGLTETKAKQFASTIGAMMKSSGLAGPEIVDMSEKLAGLAADMSSFYNMDFDTAFQKIRSGISGETEPLKQLGINMSVANLEAFALQQGLSKTFDQMSQSEQIMLRYQYLMQATADAQGDFARTSDGYANSLRLLEANVDSIKTRLGSMLIPALEQATGWVNTFLTTLSVEPGTTVLDDVANIDLKTQEKLAEIRETAEKAGELSSVLSSLANTDAGAAMKSIAEGANVLNANSPKTWESLLSALKQVDGLSNVFSNTNAGKNVEDLAKALSGNSPDVDKAAAWKEFLGALQENSGALTALTGTSAEETAAWLSSIADAANKIDPSDAEAWNKLLSNFVGGLPGLADTEGGKAFFDSMAANFLALGSESEEAKAGLLALGFNTDQIKDKQAQWLEVCNRLVSVLPGLNSIIDTQTGEVKGGVQAINDYVDAWKEGQEKIALWDAYYATQAALNERRKNEYLLELDKIAAEDRVKMLRQQYEDLGGDERYKTDVGYDVFGRRYGKTAEGEQLLSVMQKLGAAQSELTRATDTYNKEAEANAAQVKLQEERAAALEKRYGTMEQTLEGTTQAAEETAEAMTDIERAASESAEGQKDAMTRVKTAVDNAKEAYKALADHIEKTRSGIDSTVSGIFGLFNKLKTPMQKAINKMDELKVTPEEFTKNYSGDAEAYQTTSKIIDGLNSQIKYMKEYNRLLDEAKKNGLSNELASALSDGSMESFDYLQAMNDSKGDIQEISNLYKEVQKQKSNFVDALTEQKLKADEVYDSLVAKAQEATAGLDQSGAAEAALSNTVQGMVDGIAAKIPDLEAKIKEIGALLATLEEYGMSFSGLNLGTIGSGSKGINMNFSGGKGNPNTTITAFASGLDSVPFDGFLASLHEGESILTAEEARVWRNMKYGPSLAGNQFDYGAMGSAIGANMPNFNGMEVRWNGQVLGRVIAQQQANSLRTMERSGWRG